MEIVWSSTAKRDIGEVIDYLSQHSPHAAEMVEEHILATVEKLALFPRLGRPGRVEGTRELVIPRLPFIVFYSVGARRITVLRVRHAAQAWPPMTGQDDEDDTP